ncbi:MAG: helix-turn-helix domain-containing protein [Verrucomicrobiae bacterium]|nr:helix-turn-helix domain-containing protein [Verrucomicrobiae bacterium]
MSLFSTRLRIVLEKNGINQVELARRTNLTPSQVHNYLHQNFRAITKEHLESIIQECSEDVGERAELTKCYLLDVIPDSLKGYVQIDPLEKPKDFDQWFFELERLPSAFRKEFDKLYKMCAESAKARDFTKDFTSSMAVLLNKPQYLPNRKVKG